MKTSAKDQLSIHERLYDLGIHYEDTVRLRRISNTLRNWFELECGTNGHNGSTHSIERDEATDKPFRRVQYQSATQGWIDNRFPIADREKGARLRLAKLMAAFPDLTYYVQTDPRGCALYILNKSDVNGHNIEQVYSSHGTAVY